MTIVRNSMSALLREPPVSVAPNHSQMTIDYWPIRTLYSAFLGVTYSSSISNAVLTTEDGFSRAISTG